MIRLSGITWLLTYNCNLACGHCFFSSGTRGPYMDPALVDLVLGDLPHPDDMFFQHLSGGEIFLDEEALFAVIARIRRWTKRDLGISTNGFWAGDDARADAVVARLAAAGVNGVSVSGDHWHAACLDPAYPQRAARAVAKSGMGAHSWFMGARLDEGQEGAAEVNDRADALVTALPAARPVVRSIGKGSAINRLKSSVLPEGPCVDLSCCLGERGPFNPAMVWVDPYGNVSICHGIVIGNVRTTRFSEIIESFDPSSHPLLAALAADGPRGVHDLALREGATLPVAWHDRCDLCWTSRKALRAMASPLAACLEPAECYP